MEVPGWLGRADGDPVQPAVLDVAADFEAERVAVEGQGSVRVVVGEVGLMNGDVHVGHAKSACGPRFLIRDRSAVNRPRSGSADVTL